MNYNFYKNALDHAKTPTLADKVIHCAARCKRVSDTQWMRLKTHFDHKPMVVARKLCDERKKVGLKYEV